MFLTATVSCLKQESVGKRERKRERDKDKKNEECSIIKTRKIFFQGSYTLSFLREKYQNFANAFLHYSDKTLIDNFLRIESCNRVLQNFSLTPPHASKILQKFQDFNI